MAGVRQAVIALGVIGFVALIAGVGTAQIGGAGVTTTTVVQSSTAVNGQTIEFPLFRGQFTVLVVEVAPGGQIGRHNHPAFHAVYTLEGEWVDITDGQPERTVRAGQAVIHSANTWEDVRNRGTVPVKLLVVFANEQGKPLTVRP